VSFFFLTSRSNRSERLFGWSGVIFIFHFSNL
jgi:hypothetical protein